MKKIILLVCLMLITCNAASTFPSGKFVEGSALEFGMKNFKFSFGDKIMTLDVTLTSGDEISAYFFYVYEHKKVYVLTGQHGTIFMMMPFDPDTNKLVYRISEILSILTM